MPDADTSVVPAAKDFNLQEVTDHSVQESVSTGNTFAGNVAGFMLWTMAGISDGMTPWGTLPKKRDRELRTFWPTEPFLSGALSTVVARNAAFGWKLEGPDLSVQAAHEVLVNSQYGKGWNHLWIKLGFDLMTQDFGAFVQIIRQNNDDPSSPLINLTHLDAWRMYPTGDPKYPYYYLDHKNRWHKMGYWQCKNLMELPAPVENQQVGPHFELQYCAITRVLKAAQIIRNIDIYKDEKTSGRFMRAIHIVSGVSQAEMQDAIDSHKLANDQAGLLRYLQPLIVPTINPDAKVSKETIELASLPEGWDEEKSTKQYLMALAMGFLTDYQEFAPLPSGNLGSGQQSNVLHMKSSGKGPALYQALVTHLMNFGGILPQNVTFTFDEKDSKAEGDEATVKGLRATERSTRIQSKEIDAKAARALAVQEGDLTPELAAEIDQREEEQAAADAAAAADLLKQQQLAQPAPKPAANAPSDKPADQSSKQPARSQDAGDNAAAAKMIEYVSDAIALSVKDDPALSSYMPTLSAFLRTRIHKAFTMSADDLAALGYLTTDERIALSSIIGDALRDFAESCEESGMWALTSQTLEDDDLEHLIKTMAKAYTPPAGRKKVENLAQSLVENEFEDIFNKVCARLVAHQKDDAGYSHGPGGNLSAPASTKKKRTRTKVLRDDEGRITETVTEEVR